MWVNTQQVADSPEEAAALERRDFETMEALRRRVDEIVEDPATAAKLKPWYGKNCKRVCFHDEYLPAFNRPNVHLVDTDGRGVRARSPRDRRRWSTASSTRSTASCSPPGSRSTPTSTTGSASTRRVAAAWPLSERWHDGAHTLHGILSGEFPNLMMISLVQAGFGTNFLHFLSESAEHVAWLIATCDEQGIATIEADRRRRGGVARWCSTAPPAVPRATRPTARPATTTASRAHDAKAARNLVYAGSLLDYAEYLVAWRAQGTLPGTRVVTTAEHA